MFLVLEIGRPYLGQLVLERHGATRDLECQWLRGIASMLRSDFFMIFGWQNSSHRLQSSTFLSAPPRGRP
jgi:hypothetical protein